MLGLQSRIVHLEAGVQNPTVVLRNANSHLERASSRKVVRIGLFATNLLRPFRARAARRRMNR